MCCLLPLAALDLLSMIYCVNALKLYNLEITSTRESRRTRHVCACAVFTALVYTPEDTSKSTIACETKHGGRCQLRACVPALQGPTLLKALVLFLPSRSEYLWAL